MAQNNINYTLNFKANFKDVQGQLNTLRESLNSIVGMRLSPGGMSADISAAAQSALKFKTYLQSALDPKTGKMDLSRLSTQMKLSGDNARVLSMNLLRCGSAGTQSFLQITNAILNAQRPMMRFNETARALWTTLKNTAKWQISSYVLTGLTSALSNSFRFATDLNKTLNDIRIVTGDTKSQMDEFAITANKAAQALGTTTNDMAQAALIYRQQGDAANEALTKAQITVKAANAAGTSAKEMSGYLTGIWNSYEVGAESLELFADKLVRVGATTASNAEELATAMTKVAATAHSVGVSIDQLYSTIATVTSATRLSAEQVGTAFKTIYARMGDLELKGAINEDNLTTTLGTISSSLKQVGVDVLDSYGAMRDMGSIVEDLGNKWQFLTTAQKTAIGEVVAGKRQYTQLFALFDNWDDYKKTVKESEKAQGELNKQQEIYMDSIQGAKARFKATKEEFLIKLIDDDAIKGVVDSFTWILGTLNKMIDSAGGLSTIFKALAGFLMTKFAPQIANGLTSMIMGTVALIPGLGKKAAQNFLTEWESIMGKVSSSTAFANPIDQAALKNLEIMVGLKKELETNEKNLTQQKREALKIEMEHLQNLKAQEEIQLKTIYNTNNQQVNSATNAIKLNSGAIGKQAMETGTISTASFSHQLQSDLQGTDLNFGEIKQGLFSNIEGDSATIQQISANLSGMDQSIQNIIHNSLANYFNDGAAASNSVVTATEQLLNGTIEMQSAEEALLGIYHERNAVGASIKTDMTDILHLYDSTTGKILDGSAALDFWKTKGKAIKTEITELTNQISKLQQEKMTATVSSTEKMGGAQKALEGTSRANLVATTSQLPPEAQASARATIGQFVGHVQAGNMPTEAIMNNMSPVVDQLKILKGI